MLRLQRYDLRVTYVPGKLLVAADALSRAAITKSSTTNVQPSTEEPVELYVQMVLRGMPISNARLKKLKQDTAEDETLQKLQTTIMNGWPSSKQGCNPALYEYWSIKEELSVVEGLIMKGSRLVIPSSSRKLILQQIHEGHLGIEKCRRRAREVVHWPRINYDIEHLIKKCDICAQHNPKQPKERDSTTA